MKEALYNNIYNLNNATRATRNFYIYLQWYYLQTALTLTHTSRALSPLFLQKKTRSRA